MDASLLYRRVITHFKEEGDIATALSLLWKYVLTMLDCVLHKKQLEMDKITAKIEEKVEEKVSD